MRSYSQAELCLLLLYALPGENTLRESLFRKLFRALEALGPADRTEDAELDESELLRLGCKPEEAAEILRRLDQRQLLGQYLMKLGQKGIAVTTRISPEYPLRLREVLGDRAPLVLFYAGNAELFRKSCISLVGSRQLRAPGKAFARAAGQAIAQQGFCYCSGGAAGADTEGLLGAASAGGSAVVFLADRLTDHLTDRRYQTLLKEQRVVLVSEQGPELEFSAPRALSRNRLIHAMGQKVLVAQSDYGSGGTWNGTMENLKAQWSPVLMFAGEPDDPGSKGLIERGAAPIMLSDLNKLSALGQEQTSLF